MTRYNGIVTTAKQVQLVEPEFDGAAITTADSATVTLVGIHGATLSSESMTYTASLPQTEKAGWYANINLPSQPQRCHIHVQITKSGATQRWHDEMFVKDFG